MERWWRGSRPKHKLGLAGRKSQEPIPFLGFSLNDRFLGNRHTFRLAPWRASVTSPVVCRTDARKVLAAWPAPISDKGDCSIATGADSKIARQEQGESTWDPLNASELAPNSANGLIPSLIAWAKSQLPGNVAIVSEKSHIFRRNPLQIYRSRPPSTCGGRSSFPVRNFRPLSRAFRRVS